MHRHAPHCLLAFAAIVSALGAAAAELASSAFEPASRSETGALFSRLPPESTGLVVDNAYDDPAMWGKRYREFMGGGMGTGVAAGDFDQDGDVDLYVCLKTKPGRLFANQGNWKFKDVTESAGLEESGSVFGWFARTLSDDDGPVWTQGATFADIDNDGWLDLYVCRNRAPNLLYMNNGDGTFREEAERRGLDVADGSVVGAFADYDRDGWLDVFILTNQVDGTEPGGRPDYLFRNKGGGHFENATSAAGISGPTFGHSATWFDSNGDGFPDLFVANDFSGADHFYRNNGDGTFANVIDETVPHTSYSSMGADSADVNNDGHFDILVSDMATTSVEKYRRGLASSRGDVLNMGTKADTVPQYMRNSLLLNVGADVFREAACWAGLEATDWTWSVRFEDFDNDGWQDLHATNGMVREANNSDLLLRMMRALSDNQRIAAIKASPPLEESNLAFRNEGGGVFAPVTEKWGLTDVGVSFGAATADFDNDGDLDLAYINYNGGLAVYRNDASGQRRIQVRLRGSRSNAQGIGALIRAESASIGLQARELSVARGYASGSEVVAHFGLGPDASVDRLVIEWPSGHIQTFDALEADRAYVVAEPDSAPTPAPRKALTAAFAEKSEEMGLVFKDSSPLAIPDSEQMFLPFRTDRGGPGLAIADVNGDGHDDIYLSATPGSPARLVLWSNDRYTDSESLTDPDDAVEDGPPLLFDANGDGTLDLLVTKASANATAWPEAFQPTLYSNDGQGKFRATDWLPALSVNAGAACAADVDGDGDLDIFIGARSIPGLYPESPTSVLLLNQDGRYSDVAAHSPQLQKAGLVKSALFSDVDQDGQPDLVVALEWDYVRYFRNAGQGRFIDDTEALGFRSGGRGWWNGIASGDFNGDGRIDFAVGNAGLNTTYKATPEHPATLYYGDFAQNGVPLLAEAVREGDKLYPLRAKMDIGTRMPSVLRKYPKNDDFAKADMAAVYGAAALAEAAVFEADNLQSGVFLSQPNGRYQFSAFPRVAQIGPIIGMVAADMDGDGAADILATQNTDVAVPHFNGGLGLYLKGDGAGGFAPSPPAQSGIALLGNGRSIALIDPDGNAEPDALLTRHRGASAYLANQRQGGSWIEIRLRGDKPNRCAVGARVDLTYSNGHTARHEIALGGGWFTQLATCIRVATTPDAALLEAKVLWPDGSATQHVNAPPNGRWTLEKPLAE